MTMQMRSTIFLAALLYASPVIALTEPRTIAESHFGCRSKELYDRLGIIAIQRDMEAFQTLFYAAMASQQCVPISAGTVGYIAQSDYTGVCFRPRGEVDCLWIMRSILKKN